MEQGTRTAFEARMFTSQLTIIHRRLREDRNLAKLVPYVVQQRGERERNRVGKLSSYRGPDVETLSLLQDWGDSWYQNPFLFAYQPSMMASHANDPHERLVSRFLRLKHDDA